MKPHQANILRTKCFNILLSSQFKRHVCFVIFCYFFFLQLAFTKFLQNITLERSINKFVSRNVLAGTNVALAHTKASEAYINFVKYQFLLLSWTTIFYVNWRAFARGIRYLVINYVILKQFLKLSTRKLMPTNNITIHMFAKDFNFLYCVWHTSYYILY